VFGNAVLYYLWCFNQYYVVVQVCLLVLTHTHHLYFMARQFTEVSMYSVMLLDASLIFMSSLRLAFCTIYVGDFNVR